MNYRSTSQPRVMLVTLSPPLNGGVFLGRRYRIRPYTSLHPLRSNTSRTREICFRRRTHNKRFRKKKRSKRDSNPCPVDDARCEVIYLLSYRGKISIDSPAQSHPYTVCMSAQKSFLPREVDATVFPRLILCFCDSSSATLVP